MSIDKVIRDHFTFIGIELNTDGISSWRAYQCNECRDTFRYIEAVDHYKTYHKNKTQPIPIREDQS